MYNALVGIYKEVRKRIYTIPILLLIEFFFLGLITALILGLDDATAVSAACLFDFSVYVLFSAYFVFILWILTKNIKDTIEILEFSSAFSVLYVLVSWISTLAGFDPFIATFFLYFLILGLFIMKKIESPVHLLISIASAAVLTYITVGIIAQSILLSLAPL